MHFTVLVLQAPEDPRNIEDLLAPYSEELEVPEYREEDFDPEGDYLTALTWLKERPTSASRYPHVPEDLDDKMAVLRWYTGGGGLREEDGEIVRYSTYNPNSKWDWWVVGGRWSNSLLTKDGELVNETTVGLFDVERSQREHGMLYTMAVVMDGQWYEPEEFDRDAWAREWREMILSCTPDTRVTLVDCHI